MSLKPIFHRQFSHSECGPVALQIVLSCFGYNVSSDELIETVACGNEGWSVDELCEVAKKWGVHTVVRQGRLDSSSLSSLPIIVLAEGHYVVVYKFSNSKVYLADPIHGKVVTLFDDFFYDIAPPELLQLYVHLLLCGCRLRKPPNGVSFAALII